jgi:hypothetical protein
MADITESVKNCIRNVETCRNLASLLIGFYRAVTNTMMVYSDDAYSMARIFYANVREMSRRGDPMAKALETELKTYFKTSRKVSNKQNEKELERHAHALIHGTKDGVLKIENISPKVTGGVHRVVDETFKGKAGFKETDEGGVKE